MKIRLKSLILFSNAHEMSKEEIKYEINKVLDHFSDKALEELLNFLKELDSKKESEHSFMNPLSRIISEDSNLLARLAQ